MTKYTLHLIAIIPAAIAADVHDAIMDNATPAGDRFFRTTPTHVDEGGNEYVVVRTWVRPHFASLFDQLSGAFPAAEYAITEERTPAGVVERDPAPALFDQLQRIEVEEVA